MAQLPHDPWLNGFVNAVLLGSVGIWIFIISRWRRRGEILAYEPRRPVPWGPPAGILAVVFVLLAVLAQPSMPEAQEAARQPDPREIAVQIIRAMSPQVLVVGAFFFVIAVFYRATRADLGLPRSSAQGLQDAAVGLVICLAAVLPVHGLQVILLYLLGLDDEPSRHPLVEMVTSAREPNVAVLVLASVAAVVIAPICEEITFRLLLQGWLEKWEDEQLAWRAVMNVSVGDVDAGADLNEQQNDEARMTSDDVLQGGPIYGVRDPSVDIRHSSFATSQSPPSRGLAGLPYGSLPILASSLLFGLAHFGYGPEPIPLFLLAIFLGYVYQRTHRIIPCIVAHALFNLVTIVVLWRMVFQAAE